MSLFGGSPIQTSLAQAAQAQLQAARARDRRSAAAADSARRFEDIVDLRTNSVTSSVAVRRLPKNNSQQAGEEHRSDRRETPPDRVDIKG